LFFVFFTNGSLSSRLMAAFVKITLLISCVCSLAQADDNLEYKVKAAYLYNFTKFITWPATNNATFNLCVVGKSQFGNLLDALETKTALDKPIRIYHFDTVKQVKDCQIVYLETSNNQGTISIPGTLTVGTLYNTLTVSSQPFFAEHGGMIGFVIEAEKVRLHINLKALKQSGLGVSAKLIEVATLIEGSELE
jgi:hypothetical protein